MTVSIAVIVTAGVGWISRRAIRRANGERSRSRAARDLPTAVGELAGALHSGATLEAALRDLAPSVSGLLATELDGAVALLDRGHGMDRVLQAWGRATRIDGVELLVAACRFSRGGGAGLDAALAGVAAALVDRIEVADELRSLASQARTSAVVLVALPPVGAALFALLDPGFAPALVTTTAGRVCLVLGVSLDVAGAWASKAIAARALVGPPGIGTSRRPAHDRRTTRSAAWTR